jgi:enediyne biosynthesis protein E4
VADPGTGISATFLDYDNDGFLDLFVVNYLTFDPSTISELNPGAYPGPLAYPGEPNTLYRNRGDGTFDDVSLTTGIRLHGHRGMSVSAFDADRDGHVDLYVSNDDTPNALWLNNGHGQFQDVARQSWAAFNSIGEAAGSMNATIADVDGNGWPDIYVTRFGYGSLYLRQNNAVYFDQMRPSGLELLTQNDVGWGGSFVDFDNDGDPDLFIVNGSAFHLNGSLPLLLENLGNSTFTNAANQGGAFFQTPIDGRGTAILDFDNDGRLDLLVTTLGNRPFLLRNRSTNSNHWLKLQLQGTRSNPNGYGALISLTANNRTWQSEATCPTGFLSQGDPRVHFGLGSAPLVDLLEIRWPSGILQRLHNIPANQTLKLREPSPKPHLAPLP